MNYSIIRYILCRVLEFQAVFLALPCIASLVYREKEGWAYAIVLAGCLLTGVVGKAKKHGVLCKGRFCDSILKLDYPQPDRRVALIFVRGIPKLYRRLI